MDGEAGDAQTAGFLIALRAKGETAAELAGPGRDRARPRRARVSAPSGPFIDTCGTGGGRSTLQHLHGRRPSWSRAPGCGGQARQPLVHLARAAARTCWRRSARASTSTPTGSRAASRRPASASCSRRPTTRRSATSSRCAGRSGVRTIFNLLGPLTNPAGAPRQLLGRGRPGLPRAAWAEALRRAGQRAGAAGARARRDGRAVHGRGQRRRRGERRRRARGNHRPGRARLRAPRPDGDIAGGDPAHNAEVLRSVLAGAAGRPRDVVVLNAAAGIWLAGVAPVAGGRRADGGREHRQRRRARAARGLRRRDAQASRLGAAV